MHEQNYNMTYIQDGKTVMIGQEKLQNGILKKYGTDAKYKHMDTNIVKDD